MEFQTEYVNEPHATIVQGVFSDGSVALQVVSDIGEPLAKVTVNLAAYGEKPRPGHVFVYGDYSEHKGVWQALHKAGVVGDVIRRLPLAHDAEAYECPLLIDNVVELH